ncbi:MAG: HAMP domain-containing histidine kinase [Hyphomicrobiales bacterium]|nr:HAMP domain-containing histidine kinase [Hyphomicrobiales bacterium]
MSNPGQDEERDIVATWSLRARIFLIALLVVGVTLGAAAWFISRAFDAALEAQLGQELNTRLLEIERLFSLEQGKATLRHRPADPRYSIPESGVYWQISEHGTVILKSRSLWTTQLPSDDEPLAVFHSDAGPQHSRLFALSRKVAFTDASRTKGPKREFVLEVAEDKRDIMHLQLVFRRNLYVALLLIALVLFVGTLLQTWIGLGPLATLKARFRAVISGDSDRLRGNFPKEVIPLADLVNRLLEHQDAQVTKARRRASTLAHGLKTPLTIISIEAQRRAENNEADGVVLAEQVALMRGIVERELARARTHGASAGGGLSTKAHASVERLINLFEHIPGAEHLVWRNSLPEELVLAMDPDDFGEVMGNLMDNARKNAGRNIFIRAQVLRSQAIIEVRNDGRDQAETRPGSRIEEGSGLGLSIIDDVLEQYGSSLKFTELGDNAASAKFAIARRH